MFIAKKIDDININNIITNNRIKNNIMNNSFFYRAYYSTSDFTSNGIVTSFTLKNIKIEDVYNKKKIKILTPENNGILSKIVMLEKNLLEYLNLPKKKKFMIKEQLDQHYLKVIIENEKNIKHDSKYNIKYNNRYSNSFKNKSYQKNTKFIKNTNIRNKSLKNQNIKNQNIESKLNIVLKISGFWESKDEYGLTFRVIAVLPIS